MATPNKYNFYIYEVVGGVPYYFTIVSGAITTTTTKDGSELEYAPAEWDDTDLSWNRSESLHGIISKTSNQYTLYGDGAKILRHIVLTKGYDAKVKFLVDVREDVNWTFVPFSDNDINLIDSNIDYSSESVSVSLFESGMAADVLANLDTPYEIPLTGSDVVTVEHEGTTVKASFNYRYGNSTIEADFLSETFPSSGIANGDYVSLLLVPLPSEGMRPIAAESTANTLRMGSFASTRFFSAATESMQYENESLSAFQYIREMGCKFKAQFSWKFQYATIPSTPFVAFDANFIVDLVISRKLEDFDSVTRIYTGATRTTPSAAFPTTWYEDVDVDFPLISALDDADNVYFAVSVITNTSYYDAGNKWIISTFNPEDSDVKLRLEFESKKSDIQGFRLHKLAQKTVEAFASGRYGSTPFSSSFLSSPSTWVKGTYPYRTIITNGNAVKGVTSSVFKLSLKDIIEDVQSEYGCGVGITEDQLTIGRISDFYDDSTLIYDLGELTDVEIKQTNDIATNIIFGNKFDNDNDTLNGSFDYNTKSTFKSANISEKETKKEYVSPIVASIFNIERLRVSEAGKDTTGNKVNDDLYKMEVVDTAVGGKYKLAYASFSGSTSYRVNGVLSESTSYNVAFSPKNKYLRLKGIINSNAYPSVTPITFQKSERSKSLDSQYLDITTSLYTAQMYEDVGFNPDGTELLWLPFEIKCKSIVPIDLDAALATNKYGKFKGTWNGVEIHFYLKQAVMKPSNRDSFEWVGLLTPSTNILDLIF